jgi:hypothetical protein
MQPPMVLIINIDGEIMVIDLEGSVRVVSTPNRYF